MRGRRGAVIATLAAGLFWGSSFVVVKIGLSDLDPYWFVFLRFSAAALVALAAAAIAKRGPETLRLLRHPLVFWLGVSNAAGFVLQFKGQTSTTAGKAALLVNANTIFVAVASWFVLRERLGPLKTLGVAVGMAGVFLVTTGGRATFEAGPAAGDLLVLGAAVVWTFFVLLDKRLVAAHHMDIRALSAAMLVVTAAASLPPALLFAWGRAPEPGWHLWPVAYTAVLCTVIPFALWTWGMKFISATASSVILLVEVVFAMTLAALILGERQPAGALWGGALIGVAVLLASLGSKEELAPGPDIVPE